jgi:hypothetical protein
MQRILNHATRFVETMPKMTVLSAKIKRFTIELARKSVTQTHIYIWIDSLNTQRILGVIIESRWLSIINTRLLLVFSSLSWAQTQFSRSRHPTMNLSNLAKLATVCFESTGTAHKYHIFIGHRIHAYQPCLLQTMCFLFICR